MTVSALVSTNSRSLSRKMPFLTNVLNSRIHSNTSAVYVQEFWLNQNVENNLALGVNFQSFCQNRVQYKKKNGSAVTYINSEYVGRSTILFGFFSLGVNCAVVKPHPKFHPYCSTIISNVFIASFCFVHGISLFHEVFVRFGWYFTLYCWSYPQLSRIPF